jgi:hypothetical protein
MSAKSGGMGCVLLRKPLLPAKKNRHFTLDLTYTNPPPGPEQMAAFEKYYADRTGKPHMGAVSFFVKFLERELGQKCRVAV